MKRIKAFTILELTVAMLIASLCFAIVFKAFNILSGTLYFASEKNRNVSNLVLADKLLCKDFADHGMRISRSFEGLEFRSKNREVNYVFTDDYVLRRQDNAGPDTLHIPVKNIRSSFEMRESVPGELTDEFVLQTELKGQEINLSYLKKYSSEELFNK